MDNQKPADEKENLKELDEHINLKVVDQDKNAVQFKIKRHAPMRKLMNAYCERMGFDRHNIRFLTPEGERIQDAATAALLKLEDGDEIEIASAQDGGRISISPVGLAST